MAEERRVLKINPDLFSLTNNTTRKKTRKEPIKMKQAANRKREDTLRNKAKILRMIRERQADQYKNMFDNKQPLPANDDINVFNNNFDEATDFLANLEKKHNHKPAHNSTLRVHEPPSRMNYISDFMSNPVSSGATQMKMQPPSQSPLPPPMFIRSSVPSIPPPPKYGILKNGFLPTQRTYMRNMTQKNYPAYPQSQNSMHKQQIHNPTHTQTNHIEQPPQIEFNNIAPDQIINNKIQNSIEQIKQEYMGQKMAKEREKLLHVPKICKQRKIKRRTYKIGKIKGSRKIAVLISNKTIRRNINEKAQKVKQVSMSDVKKHLVNRGFIKNCTSATNDVLRKMYESTILMCGEVYNHNSDNLLYNFFNEDK